jgi:hypothetical protein
MEYVVSPVVFGPVSLQILFYSVGCSVEGEKQLILKLSFM